MENLLSPFCLPVKRATGPLMRRGMFDDQQNALPVLTVFDKYTRGKVPQREP